MSDNVKKPRRNRWGDTTEDATAAPAIQEQVQPPQQQSQQQQNFIPPQPLPSSTMGDGANPPVPSKPGRASRWAMVDEATIKADPYPVQTTLKQENQNFATTQHQQPPKPILPPPKAPMVPSTTPQPASITAASLTQHILNSVQAVDKFTDFPLASSIRYFLSIPGGQTLVEKHRQHLYPMTPSYIDSILPSGFVSYPKPEGYTAPSKTESSNFIADFSFFSKKMNIKQRSKLMMMSDANGFQINVPDEMAPMGADGMGEEEQVLQHGVLLENIPDDLQRISLSRNDMFVFNDLFTGKMTNQAARRAMIAVIIIKNGTGKERKHEVRKITRDNGKTLKLEHYLEPMLNYLDHGIQQQSLDSYERHILFSLLSRIIPIYRALFVPYAMRLVNITRTLLVSDDSYVRAEGGSFVEMLTKVVGIQPILKVILVDVSSSQDVVRDLVGRVLAHMSIVVGLKQISPFLKVLLQSSTAPFYPVDTALRSIQHIAVLSKGSLVPDMEQVVALILPTFQKNDVKIITTALNSIHKVCDACKPYICPSMDGVAQIISALAPKASGRTLISMVNCITVFLPSLPLEHSTLFWNKIQDNVIKCCQSGDSKSLVVGVTALSAAIRCGAIPPQSARDHIVPFLAHNLLDSKYCGEKNNVNAIKLLCITLSTRLGLEPIYEVLIPLLKHENPFLSIAVLNIIASVATEVGFTVLSPHSERLLIDNIITLLTTHIGTGIPSTTLQNNEPDLFVKTQQGGGNTHIPAFILNTIDKTNIWTRYPVIIALNDIIVALGPHRAEKHALRLLGFSKWILGHKEDVYRYHGSVIITLIIKQLASTTDENKKILRDTWAILYEGLGEEKPLVLTGILCAIRSTLQTMKRLKLWMLDGDEDNNNNEKNDLKYNKSMVGNDNYNIDLTPSPTDLLTKLTAILHNRHESVALIVTRTLSDLGSCWGKITPAQEWVRIVTQFVTTLLTYGHRSIRKSVVDLIGTCSHSVGSVDIILKLLPHLEHPNRTVRIGIMSAIGSVGENCGVAMVFPLLLHQYELCDLKTGTAVLKSILVCTQQCPKDTAILPTALYPLLTHVLTSKHSKIIRLGLQIATSIILNCFRYNYFEIGKQFAEGIGTYIAPLRAVNYNINSWWWEWRQLAMAMGLALSGGYTRALYTGLFHCARRVRENHFVWYNSLLKMKAHTMPLHYPKITTSDHLVNNTQLNEYGSNTNNTGMNDNNDEEKQITFDQIAENQYYDPYICQSLYIPF